MAIANNVLLNWYSSMKKKLRKIRMISGSGFFSASGQNSSNSELYIEKAPLHIGVIVHQIKKYIEVASMCPYLEQKTTTA